MFHLRIEFFYKSMKLVIMRRCENITSDFILLDWPIFEHFSDLSKTVFIMICSFH